MDSVNVKKKFARRVLSHHTQYLNPKKQHRCLAAPSQWSQEMALGSSSPLFYPETSTTKMAESSSSTLLPKSSSPFKASSHEVPHRVRNHFSSVIGYYSSVTTANPTLTRLSQTTEGFSRLFQRFLNFEYIHLTQRSPSLEDHEITLMQKAFLHLLANPEHHLGAVHLYIEEVIGIRYVQPQDKEQVLGTLIDAKVIMMQSAPVLKASTGSKIDKFADIFHNRHRPIPDVIRFTESAGTLTQRCLGGPYRAGAIMTLYCDPSVIPRLSEWPFPVLVLSSCPCDFFVYAAIEVSPDS